jgi:hypothetical protein
MADSALATHTRRYKAYIESFKAELEEEIELKKDFNQHAKELHAWILNITNELEVREFDNTLEGIRGKLAQFDNFVKTDLAAHASEKSVLEKKSSSLEVFIFHF